MNRTDREQDAQPAVEPRHRCLAAARELQAKADPEEQREDGVELAVHQDLFDKCDDRVSTGGGKGGGAIRGQHEQAEKHEHIREEDAENRDAAEGVERLDALACRREGNGRSTRVHERSTRRLKARFQIPQP